MYVKVGLPVIISMPMKLLVYCRFHSIQGISQLAKFNGGEIS